MSFTKAFAHMIIGYGARRKVWPEGVMIYLDEVDQETLKWVDQGGVCKFGPHNGRNLSYEHLNATDWEVV